MKKKWREKLHRISYMQSAIGLFVLSLLVLLALFVLALLSSGGLKLWAGLIAFLGMLMALAGFILPLYGKYVVGSRDMFSFIFWEYKGRNAQEEKQKREHKIITFCRG